MPKYIDADGLLLLIEDYLNIPRFNNDYDAGVQKVQKMIEVYPAVDVREVKHGEWEMIPPPKVYEDGAYVRFRCSECGTEYGSSGRYCPNCGTRMDGREKTDDES